MIRKIKKALSNKNKLLFWGFLQACLKAMKKISIALISVIILSVIVIVGWFTYTQYELRKAELEYMEYSQKPSGMISFWSKAEIPISIKLTMSNGEIRWIPLSVGAGFAGFFDAGNIRIERIFEEDVLASFELVLENDAKENFYVYENSFEPRQ